MQTVQNPSSTRIKVADASSWPKDPLIYEINTWVWLFELTEKYGRRIGLDTVPAAEWDEIKAYEFDAVWLMGVWQRSQAGIAIANKNESLSAEFRRVLPDFQLEDNVGSPYCVRDYVVDEHMGGPKGLAKARQELAKRGMKLILDFVPNHVAPDHPWTCENPEFLIRGTIDDVKREPAAFIDVDGTVFACGRDPYFPAWPDVLQLNAFDGGLRNAAIRTLRQIADQCDGVRCDMAMLMLNSVFARTWGNRAGAAPVEDYWRQVIPAVKKTFPGFLFIAEAYWDLEWELQQQGFDYCYDKRLYDRIEHGGAEEVRSHLCAEMDFQRKLVRFLENHDEPRAASTLGDAKQRAAAVLIASIPGAKLFHEGQFEGRKVRLPVFLGRRPHEECDDVLGHFYRVMLEVCSTPDFRSGSWKLCESSGWPDNESHRSLIAMTREHGAERFLVAVNFSDAPVQGRIHVGWDDVQGCNWELADRLNEEAFRRGGDEFHTEGLFVELRPWACHLFHVTKSQKKVAMARS